MGERNIICLHLHLGSWEKQKRTRLCIISIWMKSYGGHNKNLIEMRAVQFPQRNRIWVNDRTSPLKNLFIQMISNKELDFLCWRVNSDHKCFFRCKLNWFFVMIFARSRFRAGRWQTKTCSVMEDDLHC